MRLHSGLLDRSRPLRETDVIEGLATDQRAFYNKVQHAAIDGQAGAAVTEALRGDVALPAPTKPPRPRPRPRTNLCQPALQNSRARAPSAKAAAPRPVERSARRSALRLRARCAAS